MSKNLSEILKKFKEEYSLDIVELSAIIGYSRQMTTNYLNEKYVGSPKRIRVIEEKINAYKISKKNNENIHTTTNEMNEPPTAYLTPSQITIQELNKTIELQNETLRLQLEQLKLQHEQNKQQQQQINTLAVNGDTAKKNVGK